MEPATLAALARPGCLPGSAAGVQRIETHISWLFLTGDYAWKIKKPVDFGFLDFSTLALRRHFCEEELRLNRRTAPELYLQIDTLNGSPDQPHLNGPGPILDYALRMRRFDPEQAFDALLARGELGHEDIDTLAGELAALHAMAAVAPACGWLGSPEQVLAPMHDNFTPLLQHLSHGPARQQLEGLRQWTDARAEALHELLQARLTQGWIREGHGDAHMGNIVRYQGRTRLFDCIEFNPDLRWIDVISDLAFSFMDLLDRGAPQLAWRLLDAWLTIVGDHEGLRLLPLYVVYRALVRAKVSALRADELKQAGQTAKARIMLMETGAYLELAAGWTQPMRPRLILTMGVSGSGKSHLASALLERMGLVRLRSDVERKRLAGLAADADSQSQTGAGLYDPATTQHTYQLLLEHAETLLQAGFSVLVDATFLSRAQRAPFLELARRLQVPGHLLCCHADPAILRARVQRRLARGTDPSEADLQVLARQQQQREPLTPQERNQAILVDTGLDDALEQALAALG